MQRIQSSEKHSGIIVADYKHNIYQWYYYKVNIDLYFYECEYPILKRSARKYIDMKGHGYYNWLPSCSQKGRGGNEDV